MEVLASRRDSKSVAPVQLVLAVQIDYFLWNYAKANAAQMDSDPIHRTKTIFYWEYLQKQSFIHTLCMDCVWHNLFQIEGYLGVTFWIFWLIGGRPLVEAQPARTMCWHCPCSVVAHSSMNIKPLHSSDNLVQQFGWAQSTAMPWFCYCTTTMWHKCLVALLFLLPYHHQEQGSITIKKNTKIEGHWHLQG